jgi:hypothetical protein
MAGLNCRPSVSMAVKNGLERYKVPWINTASDSSCVNINLLTACNVGEEPCRRQPSFDLIFASPPDRMGSISCLLEATFRCNYLYIPAGRKRTSCTVSKSYTMKQSGPDQTSHKMSSRIAQCNRINKSAGLIFPSQPEANIADDSWRIHLPQKPISHHQHLLKNVHFGSLPSQTENERDYRTQLKSMQFGSFPIEKDRETAKWEVQLLDLPDISESAFRNNKDQERCRSMGDSTDHPSSMSRSRTWPLYEGFESSRTRVSSWTTSPSSLQTLSRESSQDALCIIREDNGNLIGLRDQALGPFD